MKININNIGDMSLYPLIDNISMRDIENWTIANAIENNSSDILIFTHDTMMCLEEWFKRTEKLIVKRVLSIGDMTIDSKKPDTWYKAVLTDLISKIDLTANLSKPMPSLGVKPKFTTLMKVVQNILDRAPQSNKCGAFVEYMSCRCSDLEDNTDCSYLFNVDVVHGDYSNIMEHALEITHYLENNHNIASENIVIKVEDSHEYFIDVDSSNPVKLDTKVIRIYHKIESGYRLLFQYTLCNDVFNLRPLDILLKTYELSDF